MNLCIDCGGIISKLPTKRCSKCYGIIRIGRERPEISKPYYFKRMNKRGYVEIKTQNGWVRENRYIIEVLLKRSLSKDEVVHHVNENKSDNRLDNLEVLSFGEHTKRHHLGSKRSLNTRLRLSLSAKIRLSDKTQHPCYKNIKIERIMSVLNSCKTKVQAARNLKITKKTLYKKIYDFGLEKTFIKQGGAHA